MAEKVECYSWECTFAPGPAPMINSTVKRNPTLTLTLTLIIILILTLPRTKNPAHSNLLSDTLSEEQLSPEQRKSFIAKRVISIFVNL